MEYCIGKADIHFTLWTLHKTNVIYTDANGKHWVKGVNYHYQFIQNLGYNEEEAKARFIDKTGAVEVPTIDDELRGHRFGAWYKYEKIEYPNHIFPYGKYEGLEISKCKDYDYLKYVYPMNDRGKEIQAQLKKGGFTLVDGFFNTEEEMEELRFRASLVHGFFKIQGEAEKLTVLDVSGFYGEYGWVMIITLYDKYKRVLKYVGSRRIFADKERGDELVLDFEAIENTYQEAEEMVIKNPTISILSEERKKLEGLVKGRAGDYGVFLEIEGREIVSYQKKILALEDGVKFVLTGTIVKTYLGEELKKATNPKIL